MQLQNYTHVITIAISGQIFVVSSCSLFAVMPAGAQVFDHFSKLGQAFMEWKEARQLEATKKSEEEKARQQAVASKKVVVGKAGELAKMKRDLETAEAELVQYAKDISHNHKSYSLARKLHMAGIKLVTSFGEFGGG